MLARDVLEKNFFLNFVKIITMNSNLKNEFQQEMNQKLMPLFKQGLLSIYETCKRKNVKRCLLLKEFQQALEDIPLWNDHIVEN